MGQRAKNPPPRDINDFVTLLRNAELANETLKFYKLLIYIS